MRALKNATIVMAVMPVNEVDDVALGASGAFSFSVFFFQMKKRLKIMNGSANTAMTRTLFPSQ